MLGFVFSVALLAVGGVYAVENVDQKEVAILTPAESTAKVDEVKPVESTAKVDEVKPANDEVKPSIISRSWNKTKDVTGNVWGVTKAKFNDGVDFVETKWTDNVYYIKPIAYTGLGLAVIALVYKVGKKVLDKINQLEEESDNTDNQ